jgi:hypothetical protein
MSWELKESRTIFKKIPQFNRTVKGADEKEKPQ